MTHTLHIVSHSHWDREWHQTFQQFRLRLVTLIDDVLAATAGDPPFAHFMLDGQTIAIDDYLEIRPEQAEALRQRVQAGSMLVGPWYVNADEFLVSGEALVRNLLLGSSAARAWGRRMDVGYVPDQFGHIAQLPQILRGFGIDNAVLWRGVERAQAGTVFHWRGLDGSTVLAATTPDGYGYAGWLPTGGAALAGRLRELAARLEPLAPAGGPLLVMNGGDHLGIQPDLSSALPAAHDLLAASYDVRHSTLPAYLDELRRYAAQAPVIAGELRSSRDTFLLPGVLSARMWIKQRNARAQIALERYAEPLAAMATAAAGTRYPAGELRQSWKYLLQNQPHDSICGCGIDQVHREMVLRFDWSEQIAEAVGDAALAALAARVESTVAGAEDPHTLVVTVFNGAPVPQSGRIETQVRLVGEAASYEVVDETGAPVPHQWLGEPGESAMVVEATREEIPDLSSMMSQVEGNRVFGLGVSAISMRTIGATFQIEVTIGDQALLSREQLEQAAQDALALADSEGCTKAVATIHRSTEMRLAALAPLVPACGYRTLLLRPRAKGASGEAAPERRPELLPAIENEHYRIEMDPASGALTMQARAGGMTMGPANLFVDGGDAGDLYTYCPPAQDRLVCGGETPPEVEHISSALGESLRIRRMLRVPAALADSRWERGSETVTLPIVTTVGLAPGDRLIRFETVVDNTARDHRLRVHMALPFATDHAHAETAFGLVRRAAQPDRSEPWVEQPVGTAAHQGLVAVHGEQGACVLAAPGLPEYEVIERPDGRSELALTLLRCVDWLSRSDLVTRPGEAGPALRTPEAQCQGTQRFAYALVFGAEPWRDLLLPARAFATPLRLHLAPCAEGHLPAGGAFVSAGPAAIVLSAFKGAEDGRGAILRVYNDDIVPHTAHLSWLLPARRATLVDLAENDGAVLFEEGARTSLEIAVPAAGILSLRLEWAYSSGQSEPVTCLAKGTLAEGKDLGGHDGEHERHAATIVLKAAVAHFIVPASIPFCGPSRGKTFEHLAVGDRNGVALDHDVETVVPVVAAGGQNDVRIAAQIHGLLFGGTGAEVQGAVEPYRHERDDVGPAIGPDRRDPEQLCRFKQATGFIPGRGSGARVAKSRVKDGHWLIHAYTPCPALPACLERLFDYPRRGASCTTSAVCRRASSRGHLMHLKRTRPRGCSRSSPPWPGCR